MTRHGLYQCLQWSCDTELTKLFGYQGDTMKARNRLFLIGLASGIITTGCAEQDAIDIISADNETARAKASGPYLDVDNNGKYGSTKDIDLSHCFNTGEQQNAAGDTICEIEKNNGSDYSEGYTLQAVGSVVFPAISGAYAINQNVIIEVEDGDLTIQDTLNCVDCGYVSFHADGNLEFSPKAGFQTSGTARSQLILVMHADGNLKMKSSLVDIDSSNPTQMLLSAKGDIDIRRADFTVDSDVASFFAADAGATLNASALQIGAGEVYLDSADDIISTNTKISANNAYIDARDVLKTTGLQANCLETLFIDGEDVNASNMKVTATNLNVVAEETLTLKGAKTNTTYWTYITSDGDINANGAQITSSEVRMKVDGNIALKNAKLDVKTFDITTVPSTWFLPELDARGLRVANSAAASVCLNDADLADEVDMSVILTKADATTCSASTNTPE